MTTFSVKNQACDEEEKNIGYNILDLFAKCFVGIFFWAYYAKVFTLN